MKIMTFNTQHCENFISKEIDFEKVARFIVDSDVDFVGLNEMRGEGPISGYTAQTEKLSELTGMPYYFFSEAIMVGGTNPYGNGFLSKIPVLKAEKIMIPDPEVRDNNFYETRCIIKVKLEGGITVLVTHFGLNESEKINAVNTVLSNIEKEKCILMGDFNMTPDDALLRPIKEKMKDVAETSDTPLLSWPSDNPEKKIDYIFVSRDIEVTSADIPEAIVSDHRAHTAEIVIK